MQTNPTIQVSPTAFSINKMRLSIRIFVIIFLSVFTLQAYSVSPDSLFQQANRAYQKGEFGNAVEGYEAILKTGQASAALYMNLGNAYFKAGIIPAAILNYEKALRLSPGDEDIRFNLEMANHRIVDKIEIIPEFFITAWFREIQQWFSADAWAKASIGFVVFFLLMLSLFLFTRRIFLKKFSFPLGILALILAIASFWFGMKQNEVMKNRNEAIIFNPTVTVKGSPDPSSTDLFLLHEGTKVSLMDSISNWREIRIADGNKGWVEVHNLRII